MSEIDDKSPFGNSFSKPLLAEETVSREYAKTGSPIQVEKEAGVQEEEIKRVAFDFNAFQEASKQTAETQEEEEEEHQEIKQTEHNSELSPEEAKLNKKVQASITRTQSKNMVAVYIMILRAGNKWLGKYDENKLTMMHNKGQINMNIIIQNHPLIYHIREMNNKVDQWEMDEDQEDSIKEALEAFLISKDIQASPGMNLALAMGVPAVEMIMSSLAHKREVKSLIQSVQEMHKVSLRNEVKVLAENNFANELKIQLDQEREKNIELMRSIDTPSKKESIIPEKQVSGNNRTPRKSQPEKPIILKTKKPAVQIETSAEK